MPSDWCDLRLIDFPSLSSQGERWEKLHTASHELRSKIWQQRPTVGLPWQLSMASELFSIRFAPGKARKPAAHACAKCPEMPPSNRHQASRGRGSSAKLPHSG